MTSGSTGPELFKVWREKRGLSLRQTAAALGVSGASLHEWERGSRHCSEPYRVAIEKLTDGEVPASSWPMSAREQRVRAHTAGVTALPPLPPSSGAALSPDSSASLPAVTVDVAAPEEPDDEPKRTTLRMPAAVDVKASTGTDG